MPQDPDGGDLDGWLPALAAVAGVMVAVVASYFGGFLGIGLAGLLMGFCAVSYDLQKQDVGGGFPSPSLYARQLAVREQMRPEERIAHQESIRAMAAIDHRQDHQRGLIVLGFGGYLLL